MHALARDVDLDFLPLMFKLQVLHVGPVIWGKSGGNIPFAGPILEVFLRPIVLDRLLRLRKIRFIFNPAGCYTGRGIQVGTAIAFIQVVQ